MITNYAYRGKVNGKMCFSSISFQNKLTMCILLFLIVKQTNNLGRDVSKLCMYVCSYVVMFVCIVLFARFKCCEGLNNEQ